MKKKTSYSYYEVKELANLILDDFYGEQKAWYFNGLEIADKNDNFLKISAPSTWFYYKDWCFWTNKEKIDALCCYIIDFCLSNGWKVTGVPKKFLNAIN